MLRVTCLVLCLLSTSAPTIGQAIVKSDFRAALGYTLIAPVTSPTTYLIDNDGRVVHQWLGGGAAGLVVYLLPNGHLLRTGTVTSTVFGASAGSGGRIDELGWDGALVWTYTLSTDRYLMHHDIAPLPNGNVLTIAWEIHTVNEAIEAGRDPNRLNGGSFWTEAIFEIRPALPAGGDIVWEWHAWDHLVQDFDPGKSNYADVSKHPERMDINFGPQTPDWLHFNAIAYNPGLDQIVVSSRTLSEVWVIDHSTTAAEAMTHSGGRSNKGGDIIYRWGNPQTYRAGTAADQKLFDQHGVHWIPNGLPGAGHFLIFSNGNARNFSTVDEIAPPVDKNGRYSRDSGAAYGPPETVWSYGRNDQPQFLSRIFGGAQRLPNGNTLICISTSFRTIEVTPEGEVVWEMNTGDLTGGTGSGSFRAFRIPVNYDALRRTALFRRAPHLLSAASRVEGPVAPAALVSALGYDFDPKNVGVDVTDGSGAKHPAHIMSASQTRVEFQIPAEAVVGPARITVHRQTGDEQSADIRIDPVAPALFSANGDGKGVGVIIAVHLTNGTQWSEPAFIVDFGTQRAVPKLISLDHDKETYLFLYGTGIRKANLSNGFAVSVGGAAVPVIQISSIDPGVDVIHMGPLPKRLEGRGEVSVSLTAGGKNANEVSIAFR